MKTIRVWGAALISCAVLLSVTLFSPSPSRAQSTDEDARRHFRLGQAHYENGSFLEAAREFEEAYRLSDRAQLLYNIYVAYRDAGDLQHSRDALREYLSRVPDAENASMLRARLEALDRMLAAGTASEAGTGSAAGAGTGTQTETGTSSESGTDAEAETETETETGAGAGSGAESGTGSGAASGSTGTGSGGGLSALPFVVMGAGAALMVGGAITGAIALSTQSSLDSRCPDRICPPGIDYQSDASTGKALAITTDVLLITGGVAIAGGLVWMIVELSSGGSSAEAAPVSAACGPDGCAVVAQGRF